MADNVKGDATALAFPFPFAAADFAFVLAFALLDGSGLKGPKPSSRCSRRRLSFFPLLPAAAMAVSTSTPTSRTANAAKGALVAAVTATAFDDDADTDVEDSSVNGVRFGAANGRRDSPETFHRNNS